MPSWFQSEFLAAGSKAFLIALVLTPILRDVFRSYNIVDQPGTRKVHQYPIPRIGGIPIAFGYFIALWGLSVNPELGEDIWKIIPGAVVVFLVGLVDDFVNLRPLVKLAGQFAAAVVAFSMGLGMDILANQPLPFWLNFPLTIAWLLLTTNALNLIDGLDGLCAGIGLVATLALLGAALLHDNTGLAIATVPLVGALLGFLSYNMNPATVFLGDSGALLIGFLLGCYGMVWTQKTATLLSLLVPVLVLVVPLLDVSLAILRRFLNNRPVFSADRAHIHHRLLDHGLTPRKTVLVLYLFAASISGIAILLSSPVSRAYQNGIMLVLLGMVVLGVRQLRYQEFQAVSQFLRDGELPRRVLHRMQIAKLQSTLERAGSEQDWWQMVCRYARDQNWSKVTWRRPWDTPLEVHLDPTLEPGWTFTIPLEGAGKLEIQGATDHSEMHPDLPRLAQVLRTTVMHYEPEDPLLPLNR